jgi:vWA domain found in the FtsH ternary systems/N-terminal helical region fused to the FtsH ternary system vWA domain
MVTKNQTVSQAEATVTASLVVARPQVRQATLATLAMQSLLISAGEQPQGLCMPFVFDWVVLVSGEPLVPALDAVPLPLEKALRKYEDHVLARLVSEPRFVALSEAVAATSASLRPTALGLCAAHVQMSAQQSSDAGLTYAPAVLRRCSSRSVRDLLEAGREALEQPEVIRRLVASLEALVWAARQRNELISDVELFWAQHIASLHSLAGRTALAQLAQASRTLDDLLPRRLKAPATDESGQLTALTSESSFPMGGFSSVSTKGSLENLVASELMYMEERTWAQPDLFEVRFVEGELLYYSRDEAVAVRRKRRMVFVFNQSTVNMRTLDGGESYQRTVWLVAAVVAFIRKMAGWLSHETLQFDLLFTRLGTEVDLADEAAAAELLLASFVSKGQVHVHHVNRDFSLDAAREKFGAESFYVLLSGQPEPEKNEQQFEAWWTFSATDINLTLNVSRPGRTTVSFSPPWATAFAEGTSMLMRAFLSWK